MLMVKRQFGVQVYYYRCFLSIGIDLWISFSDLFARCALAAPLRAANAGAPRNQPISFPDNGTADLHTDNKDHLAIEPVDMRTGPDWQLMSRPQR